MAAHGSGSTSAVATCRSREIAPSLQQAVLATEDRRFYWHPGIDPIGLARAVFVNARSGEMREGASTLTQQLARTLFLSNRRTLGRKVQEAALAVMLEVRLVEGADPRAVSESRLPQRRACTAWRRCRWARSASTPAI